MFGHTAAPPEMNDPGCKAGLIANRSSSTAVHSDKRD